MVILIAEEQERKLIAEYLPGVDAQVIVTGVGALNVMKATRSLPLDTEIVNIGYAGSANFEVGQMVLVTEANLNHPLVSYAEPKCLLNTHSAVAERLKAEGRVIESVGYTGVDFVVQSDYKDCVFDMELAFICGMGFTNVTALKYVSDNLSLHDYRKVGAGV